MPQHPLSRRHFLAFSGAATLACASTGAWAFRGAPVPRVAVVGCGHRGMRHLRQLARMPGHAGIAAVCDNAEAPLTRAAALSGANPCSDWRSLLSDEIDAVVLATPDPLRGEMMRAFIAQGKHVFCETPWHQAASLASDARVCLGAPLRAPHAQAWREVRRVVGEGTLGTLRWSQMQMQPLHRPTRETWLRNFTETILPLAALYPHQEPSSVSTLGSGTMNAGLDGKGRIPESFLTEFRFEAHHTVLVQCTQANSTGHFPVLRGSNATLELRGTQLNLFPGDAQQLEAPHIFVASTPPLENWLLQIGEQTPDSELPQAMVRAENFALQALEAFQRG